MLKNWLMVYLSVTIDRGDFQLLNTRMISPDYKSEQ